MSIRTSTSDQSFEALGEPIVIEHDEISCRPTNDRVQLVECIQLLAKKVAQALEIDYETNKRLARRLTFSNRLTFLDENGKIHVDDGRETIQIKLPYTVDTWNELSEIDIQHEMLRSVVDIHDQYIWYQVQVLIDNFICPLTRKWIDVLDIREIDQEAANKIEREIIEELKPSVIEPDEEEEEDSPVELETSQTTVEMIEVKPEVVIDEIAVGDDSDSDDDGDVMIVDEIKSPASKLAMRPPLTPNSRQMTEIQKSIRRMNRGLNR